MLSSESAQLTILVVDDDQAFRERLVRAFVHRGHRSLAAAGHDDALRIAASLKPDLALVDLRMPGKSGLEVVQDLARTSPRSRVIVLTGYGSIASATEAMRLGADDYLTKPADPDQILAAYARQCEPPSQSSPPPAERRVPTLERVEWEHIQRVLADSAGNISQAARALGIHRRSLQRKLARRPPPCE